MKKDREFDNILDECIERVFSGESVEDCLKAYPEQSVALRPLLQTALNTRRAAEITPRPEFRQRAAYEFQAALRELPPQRRVGFRWQVRLVTVLSVIVAILMAGTGTVAAASNSLPDQTLYPVKLVTEEVRLVLTPSALGKVELYAEYADKRVAEIIVMADKGNIDQVVKTTERMNDQLIAMASLSLPARGPAGAEDAPLALLAAPETGATAAAPEPAEIPMMAKAPDAIPSPRGSLGQQGTSEDMLEPAAAPRRENGPVPVPVAANDTALSSSGEEESANGEKGKVADLKVALARQAEKNTQQLEDILNRVPDNIKPALKKALEVAGNGYEEALKNIGRNK